MKKNNILSLIFLALFFVACDDLNISPSGSIAGSDYYNTEEDATASVTGVYNVLTYEKSTTSYYGDMLLYTIDLSTDYMRAAANSQSPDTRALSSVTFDAGQFHIKTVWEQSYRGVSRANLAIDNIPRVNGDETLKNRLINEAKFLRALFYFNLVQLYGDVPLITSGEYKTEDLNRAPVEDVYSQIIKDLTDAQQLPETQAEKGRATKGSATALLARVYLVKASITNSADDYRKAAQYAQEVIGSKQYSLVENYYDLWDPTKKNGPEHIFSAQFTNGQAGTGAGNSISHCVFSTGLSDNEPVLLVTDTVQFYNVFDDNDQRKNVSFAKRLFDPSKDSYFEFAIPRFRKYIDTTILATSTSQAAINVPIIRYADVFFTLAEATNETEGPNSVAYNALNQIRRRAYRQPLDAVSPYDIPSGLTQADFRDTLRAERFKEFVTEQTRWLDLVRWKILVKTVKNIPGKNIDFKNYRFPIPQRERDINPEGLWQNWGYEDSKVQTNPYQGYE
jgi:hypothetical protein